MLDNDDATGASLDLEEGEYPPSEYGYGSDWDPTFNATEEGVGVKAIQDGEHERPDYEHIWSEDEMNSYEGDAHERDLHDAEEIAIAAAGSAADASTTCRPAAAKTTLCREKADEDSKQSTGRRPSIQALSAIALLHACEPRRWNGRWFHVTDASGPFIPDYVDKATGRIKERTTCACMNDGEPFDGPVHTLPIRIRWTKHGGCGYGTADIRYLVPLEVLCNGVFCCWPCALRYARLHYSPTEYDRIRSNICRLNGGGRLPAEAGAPEKLLAKHVGANGLSIEEYRRTIMERGPYGGGVYRDLTYPLISQATVVEATQEVENMADEQLATAARCPSPPGKQAVRRRYGNRKRQHRRNLKHGGAGRKDTAAAAAATMTLGDGSMVQTTHERGVYMTTSHNDDMRDSDGIGLADAAATTEFLYGSVDTVGAVIQTAQQTQQPHPGILAILRQPQAASCHTATVATSRRR